MKALLFSLILVFSICFTTHAQSVQTATKSGDAIANSGTSDISMNLQKEKYSLISFQIVITKVSGTFAGTTVLQASNDGTNWQTVGDTTLTHANQTTNSLLWKISSPAYSQYRTHSAGSGTMNATPVAYIRLTK